MSNLTNINNPEILSSNFKNGLFIILIIISIISLIMNLLLTKILLKVIL